MSVPLGPGVGGPGVVEPVALDLEGPAGAGELVPHLVEEAFKRGLLYSDEATAQLVSRVMVAAETEKFF